MDWGRIVHLRYYAGGKILGFQIGFACGAVYFQKGYYGPMYSSIAALPSNDICGLGGLRRSQPLCGRRNYVT